MVADVRRSMMDIDILRLLGEGAITLDDLDGFSEQLRGVMTHLMHSDLIDPEKGQPE